MRIESRNWKRFPIVIAVLLFLSFPLLISNAGFLNQERETPLRTPFPSEIDLTKNTTEYNATWNRRQWLQNSDFSSMDGWNSAIYGDSSDIEFVSENNAAGLKVIGESCSFSEVWDPPTANGWAVANNPEFPAFPDWDEATSPACYGINGSGMWARHYWYEGPNQTPSVQWVKNFTMPRDMSSYRITSVQVGGSVHYNVNEDVDQPGDTIGGYGDSRKGSVYDWVKYYIRVSDRARQVTYELASYRTQNLGKDGVPDALLFNDTLNSVPQELLISFLSFVLANDNNSMMLIVGMDIFCEDNVNTDWDTFYLLTINHFYLNFTYEKIINQGNYLQLSQSGPSISETNTYVQWAKLGFKYGSSEPWPTVKSPNSEFRILINDNQHSEMIRFSQADTSLKDSGEMDVTKLIRKGVNISVAIQFYIADVFEFTDEITVSIDDVYLEIEWVEVVYNPPPPPPEPPKDNTPLVAGLMTGMAGMVTFGLAYQFYFKYPASVRKLRGLRRRMRSGKPVKQTSASPSNVEAVQEKHNAELKKSRIVKTERAIESDTLKSETELQQVGSEADVNASTAADTSVPGSDAKDFDLSAKLKAGDEKNNEMDNKEFSPLPDKPMADDGLKEE